MALATVNWSAPVSPLAGTVLAGQCLVPDASGLYVVATTANRALYGRSDGIAMTAGDVANPCALIEAGPVENALTGLGAGLASWVRVSATGICQRVTTPSTGDDVIGWCETSGRLHSTWGTLTAAIVNGGGGGFTAPTGTGLVTVTGGALNGAAMALPLSAASVVQATGTGIPHVVAGALSAASSLIVNADVSAGAAIALSKIVNPTGTGLVKASGGAFSAAAATLVDADVAAGAAIAVSKLAAGTNTYVLTTTGGVAVWAAPAGGGGLGANVTSGTNYISIGATGATVGALRLPSASAGVLFRDSTNANDLYALAFDASDNMYIGTSTAFNAQASNLNIYAAGTVAMGLGGSTYAYLSTGIFEHWKPTMGSATGSSVWGAVDGMAQVVVSTLNITLTSAQYSRQCVKFTGSPAAARTITFPLPTTDDESYVKTVWAQQTVSALTIINGGGTSVTLTAGSTPCTVLFTTLGAVRLT